MCRTLRACRRVPVGYVLSGIFLCGVGLSTNLYANGKTAIAGNAPDYGDDIAALKEEVRLLKERANDVKDLKDYFQKTDAQLHTQLTQMQTQLATRFGTQVQEIAQTSSQVISFLSVFVPTLSLALGLFFSIIAWLSRKDYKENAAAVRDQHAQALEAQKNETRAQTESLQAQKEILERSKQQLQHEIDRFRTQVDRHQLTLVNLNRFSKTLEPAEQLRKRIEKYISQLYEPPGEIKRDLIEMLLRNDDFSREYKRWLYDQLEVLRTSKLPADLSSSPREAAREISDGP